MQSSAGDVGAYLADVPDARRPVLDALRHRCLEHGMPVYRRDGVGEVAWALYIMAGGRGGPVP